MRTYFNSSTQELRVFFEKFKNDVNKLNTILDELQYRSTSLAKKLEAEIKQWIKDNNFEVDFSKNIVSVTINPDFNKPINLSKTEKKKVILENLSKSIEDNNLTAIKEFYDQEEINRRDIYEMMEKEVVKKLFFELRPDLLISREEIQLYPNLLRHEKEFFNLFTKASEMPTRVIIKKRKIERLFHFTRLDNLPSIFKYGIVPRSEHRKFAIHCNYNDEQRLDEELEFTSLSISFPNDHLLRAYQCKQYSLDWALIEIDPAILISDRIRYYCNQNAAHEMPGWSNLKVVLCTPQALELMFADEHQYKNMSFLRSELLLPDEYTTNPQAEILINGVINQNHILKIYLKTKANMEYLKKHCDRKIFESYSFDCNNSHYFDKRHDYEFWPTGRRY